MSATHRLNFCQTATSFHKLVFENSLKFQPRTAALALLFAFAFIHSAASRAHADIKIF
jgi:hypothetical protein